MRFTVYNVDKDEKYLFIADGPKNALEKMAYMLNVLNQDLEFTLKETGKGFLLQHRLGEFWVRKVELNGKKETKPVS